MVSFVSLVANPLIQWLVWREVTTLIPYTFYTFLMWFYGANRCPIQAQSVNFQKAATTQG